MNTDARSIVDMIYPIGSYYWSSNAANPSSIFGGTWEQVKDKFVLVAGDSYKVGTTGGEASHKLSVNEIPSHAHGVRVRVQGYKGWESFTSNSHGVMFNANSDSGSNPHNNMPPYITAYCWHRTA